MPESSEPPAMSPSSSVLVVVVVTHQVSARRRDAYAVWLTLELGIPTRKDAVKL